MNERIQNLRKSLADQKIDALLVSNPLNVFYLSDFKGVDPTSKETFLLVTKDRVFLLVNTNTLCLGNAEKLKDDLKLIEITQKKTFSK